MLGRTTLPTPTSRTAKTEIRYDRSLVEDSSAICKRRFELTFSEIANSCTTPSGRFASPPKATGPAFAQCALKSLGDSPLSTLAAMDSVYGRAIRDFQSWL